MEQGPTYTFACADEGQMDALAAALAPLLHPGDVFALSGTLGAGKTRFVQGVARALGIGQPVTSPTFAILETYEGSLPLHHFDLYRLEAEADLDDIGFWEVLEGEGASFVEWADKFPESLPDDYVELHIAAGENGVRILSAKGHGPRAAELLCGWAQA